MGDLFYSLRRTESRKPEGTVVTTHEGRGKGGKGEEGREGRMTID